MGIFTREENEQLANTKTVWSKSALEVPDTVYTIQYNMYFLQIIRSLVSSVSLAGIFTVQQITTVFGLHIN